MTLDEFRARYPEFGTASAPMIQRYLNEAANHVSADVLGTAYDAAHGLKAADLLARSPSGIAARMVAKDGSTTYATQFKALLHTRICGVSVV